MTTPCRDVDVGPGVFDGVGKLEREGDAAARVGDTEGVGERELEGDVAVRVGDREVVGELEGIGEAPRVRDADFDGVKEGEGSALVVGVSVVAVQGCP